LEIFDSHLHLQQRIAKKRVWHSRMSHTVIDLHTVIWRYSLMTCFTHKRWHCVNHLHMRIIREYWSRVMISYSSSVMRYISRRSLEMIGSNSVFHSHW
jgi:hypothetical protein